MLKNELLKRANEKIEGFGVASLREAGLLPLIGLFVPCIYYPPTDKLPASDENKMLNDYSLDPDHLFTVYIHIPFCINRCTFCHCVVSTARSSEEKDRYLDALETEIDIFMKRKGLDMIKLRSILVGGGTPTDLSIDQMKRFFDLFSSRFDKSKCTQFSYDVDVTTLLGKEGMERLLLMKENGVERLTIGAQSFDDTILKNMNRTHEAKDIFASIEQARQAGYKDICLDLIYGYPGQTLENWADTLEAAISCGVEEIQLYRLKIVPYGRGKSIILNKYASDADDFLAEGDELLMKEYAALLLSQKGYNENLTRVFCRDPKYISHYTRDMCCFLHDTAGFGLTASSSYRDRFFQNAKTFKDYYSLIEKGSLPIVEGKVRNKDEQSRWAFILPLKNWEVNKKLYGKITGNKISPAIIKKTENLEKFDLINENDKATRLSERGRFFADQVCQQFFNREYLPFPENSYARGELDPYK